MSDCAPRPTRTGTRAFLAVIVLLGTLSASPVAATTGTSPGGTTPGAPETTAPEPTGTSEPETTEADVTTSVTETPSEELVGAEPDTDGDVALIAIVGLVLVLSLAAWWMVRRDDERPVPDREPPPTDLI